MKLNFFVGIILRSLMKAAILIFNDLSKTFATLACSWRRRFFPIICLGLIEDFLLGRLQSNILVYA